MIGLLADAIALWSWWDDLKARRRALRSASERQRLYEAQGRHG